MRLLEGSVVSSLPLVTVSLLEQVLAQLDLLRFWMKRRCLLLVDTARCASGDISPSSTRGSAHRFYPGQLDVLEEAVPTSRVSSSFSLSMFVMFMVAHQCSDPVGIALPLSGWSVARVFLARHISLFALLLFLRYFVSGKLGVQANIGEEYAHLRRSEEDLGSEVVFRMDDEWSIDFGPHWF